MSEDAHYNFCVEQGLSHLHYACPEGEYANTMTVPALKEFETVMKNAIHAVANSDEQNVDNLSKLLPIPEGIDRYGLLDYIAIGNIEFGAKALYRLGYRPDIESPPSNMWGDDDSIYDGSKCWMNFYHPNRKNEVSYEDVGNHDFCKLWHELKTLHDNSVT